jgi:hypothetical protein
MKSTLLCAGARRNLRKRPLTYVRKSVIPLKTRFLFVLFWFLMSAPFALAYQETRVENGGTIRGQVVLQGTRPSPQFLPVHKNREVCGEQVPDESLQVGPHSEVKNVAVVLEGIRAGKPKPSSLAVLDNARCAFVPRVQTLTVGQELELRNSDPILHTVHARQRYRGTLFNVGLPVWRRVQQTLLTPGLMVIDCDVLHTWMRAYIIVTEHPYATVTDAEGRFTLDHVPPGIYTLHLWHERLGTQESPVQIRENQVTFLTFVYKLRDQKKSTVHDQLPPPRPSPPS